MHSLKAHSGQARGDVALYLTTRTAQALRKPGDYYLRASTTQPGWVAIEYIPPTLVRVCYLMVKGVCVCGGGVGVGYE